MCPSPPPPGIPNGATPQASSQGGNGASAPAGARRVTSSELFGSGSELVIVHGQREYRLRVTSNGKLILTA